MSFIPAILSGDSQKKTEEHKNNGRSFKGKILKLSKKGYGFVTTNELEFTRIFFHWSVLTCDSPKFNKLVPNMPAEFNAIELPGKGWRAVMVRVDANTTKGEET